MTAEADDVPLKSAHLIAYLVVNPDIKHHALSADDGTYKIDGLTSGTYVVYANKAGYYHEWYKDKARASEADLIEVTEPDAVAGVDFGLATAHAISGVVTDAKAGSPIAGARVYAANWLSSVDKSLIVETRSDRNGEYMLQVKLPGNYLVRAEAESYVGEFYDDARTIGEATAVKVDTNQHAMDINFDLAMLGKMTGKVIDEATGKAIPNALIEAFREGARNSLTKAYRTKSDSDGVFLIEDMWAGKYLVKSSAKGYLPEFFEESESAASASFVTVMDSTLTEGIDFTLGKGGLIAGVIQTQQDSLPIANAKIVVQKVRTKFCAAHLLK